ncbi:MAG TPA: D-alanyl-D-alanine dipeptidase [Synechococcales bacterium UBA10510]|nr:D-alanyl-D-alanine dipeptidase [Synechococcales bacterium UBA10510]
MRPWSSIPIRDCAEPLSELPPQLWRLQPHPYVLLGAPYGSKGSPFRLRSGVIERLLRAQNHLQRQAVDWRLAIFDGWRPLAVQRFMVEHTIAELCAARQLDRHQPAAVSACAATSTDAGALLEHSADQDHSADLDHSAAIEQVIADVGRFWATPSEDPATPPPHSTGAAVDLSLADAAGQPLAMGSPIDAIGAVSEPNHFAEVAAASSDSAERLEALEWHRRRQLLAAAMQQAGFEQHPNEWWHFSWGDQMWAWRSGSAQAHYGRTV